MLRKTLDKVKSCLRRVNRVLAWYDIWVGVFWDQKKRRLYILPIPCVGIYIQFSVDNES